MSEVREEGRDTNTEEARVEEIRARAEAATPGPWRWHGWMNPDRHVLPELEARNARVLAFTEEEAVRVVYRDDYDQARITPSESVREELLDDLRDRLPVGITINDSGEEDPNGRYLAFAERGHVMAFMRPDGFAIAPVGSEGVSERWDCYQGKTTAEAGREPYRHDISGIAHPDAEFIAHARKDVDTLLAALSAVREENEEGLRRCVAEATNGGVVPSGSTLVEHAVAVVEELAEDQRDDLTRAENAEAERDRYREALEEFVRKYEWALNDARYTAPEDTARMNRQWHVLGEAADAARAVLEESQGKTDERHA